MHRNKQKANLYLAMSSMKTVFFIYKVFFGKLTNFQVHIARTCIYFFLYSLSTRMIFILSQMLVINVLLNKRNHWYLQQEFSSRKGNTFLVTVGNLVSIRSCNACFCEGLWDSRNVQSQLAPAYRSSYRDSLSTSARSTGSVLLAAPLQSPPRCNYRKWILAIL